MSELIFLILMKVSFANWDQAWQVPQRTQWQKPAPQNTDTTGISVYCAFSRSTQRTKIYLTLQNRGEGSLCLHANQLLKLTPQEMNHVEESMPRMSRGTMHTVAKTHFELKKFSRQRLRTNFSCRVLDPQSTALPPLTYDPQSKNGCGEAMITLPPEGVFELASEFYVPYLPLREFILTPPSSCDGSHPTPSTPMVFRCEEPEAEQPPRTGEAISVKKITR